MTDREAMYKLYVDAATLERDMRYEEASDAFLVLADAAEERGETEDASSLRGRALRNHVAAWSRQRWPREGIHVHNVVVMPPWPGVRRTRIHLTVWRRDAERWEWVSVGRRGDVRFETGGIDNESDH